MHLIMADCKLQIMNPESSAICNLQCAMNFWDRDKCEAEDRSIPDPQRRRLAVARITASDWDESSTATAATLGL